MAQPIKGYDGSITVTNAAGGSQATGWINNWFDNWLAVW